MRWKIEIGMLFIIITYEYPAEHPVKRYYGVATENYKLIH